MAVLQASYTAIEVSGKGLSAPYIFVLVMEFWSIQMELSMAAGRIKPIKRGMDSSFSHLLFADDMLIFCKGNKESLREVNILLAKLSHNTGLSINKSKSKIFFSRGAQRYPESRDRDC